MKDIIMDNWTYITVGLAFLVAVISIIVLLRKWVQRRLLRKDLSLQDGIKSEQIILKNRKFILKSLHKDSAILDRNPLIGEIWLRQIREKGNVKLLNALMTYAPSRYHFDCFMASLDKRKLMEAYYPYLQGEDDMYLIERLAQSCNGRDFNAEKATPFLKGSLYSLRDLTSSPNWENRFFAYNMLLHSDNEKAIRSIWEGAKDPHPRVRKLILAKMIPDNREKFYNILFDTFVDDPYYEVRQVARERIHKEFREFYKLEPAKLQPVQQQRVLELLDSASDKDINFALEVLSGNKDYLSQAAVKFLSSAGVLKDLFSKVRCSDQGEMKRVELLLQHAIEVGSEDFFNDKEIWRSEGPLLLASRLLKDAENKIWLDYLAEAVFKKDPRATDYSWEIFQNTIEAVDHRGSDKAQQLKSQLLTKFKNRKDILCSLLTSIPESKQHLYKEKIMEVFQDELSPCRDLICDKLADFRPAIILHDLYRLLRDDHSPLKIKQDALKILIRLKQPYTLQSILENLPLLEFDDLVQIQDSIQSFAGDDFLEKVEVLLKSYDATVRAAIITVLPQKIAQKYSREIEDALKDSYADVRIAAAYKLQSLGKIKDSGDPLLLLKDPVDRVRIASARIFADMGSKNAIEVISSIIKSEDEVDTVKKSLIDALVLSSNTDSLEPIMDTLEHNESLEQYIVTSLAQRYDAPYLTQLIEHFRDATPILRKKLVAAFAAMGEGIEDSMADLLTEEVASLQTYLIEIMELTGFIENLQRKLAHRDPDIRRRTTELLSLIGTKSAFKGIVLASRDPDPQVRVNVCKALDRLNSPEGKSLLKELEGDPDKRVRRYTHWALERIKVKGSL